MPVTIDKPAPYGPPSAIVALIEKHRSRGLPATVDSDALARSSIPESLIPRTLQALQTLDLIDADGKVTPTMEGLRKAPEAEYKARMAEWLNAAYHDALQFIDPAVDDETSIRDAFRSYIPTGQQARMVTTFIGLYAAAGVRVDRPRAAPRVAGRERTSASTKTASKPTKRNTPPPPPPPYKSQIDNGLPPALAGLLTSLPPAGQPWTSIERDRFVVTFGAVLDFCFPVDDRPRPKVEQESDNGDDE
ncbi:DUF5343 domain-containing protein [Mesorhizobium sp. M0243]|uniref:DUF5343 domain-containing protein n=1 Tax=Mesorhizobium sp. M0243 TaxID=2956925 RepID=UPI003338A121